MAISASPSSAHVNHSSYYEQAEAEMRSGNRDPAKIIGLHLGGAGLGYPDCQERLAEILQPRPELSRRWWLPQGENAVSVPAASPLSLIAETLDIFPDLDQRNKAKDQLPPLVAFYDDIRHFAPPTREAFTGMLVGALLGNNPDIPTAFEFRERERERELIALDLPEGMNLERAITLLNLRLRPALSDKPHNSLTHIIPIVLRSREFLSPTGQLGVSLADIGVPDELVPDLFSRFGNIHGDSQSLGAFQTAFIRLYEGNLLFGHPADYRYEPYSVMSRARAKMTEDIGIPYVISELGHSINPGNPETELAAAFGVDRMIALARNPDYRNMPEGTKLEEALWHARQFEVSDAHENGVEDLREEQRRALKLSYGLAEAGVRIIPFNVERHFPGSGAFYQNHIEPIADRVIADAKAAAAPEAPEETRWGWKAAGRALLDNAPLRWIVKGRNRSPGNDNVRRI